MTKEKDDLQPCPFCKSVDLKVHFTNGFEFLTTWYYVQCMSCGGRTEDNEDRGQAITAWNTRPRDYMVANAVHKVLSDKSRSKTAMTAKGLSLTQREK